MLIHIFSGLTWFAYFVAEYPSPCQLAIGTHFEYNTHNYLISLNSLILRCLPLNLYITFSPVIHSTMGGEQAESPEQIYDIAIIGAGPCGLAAAARIREATPSALFTDVEHQRFHWVRRNRHHLNLVASNGRANRMRLAEKTQPSSKCIVKHSMLVLDSTSDTWMGRWNTYFDRLKIEHLRSPLFFHPDPRDRDGLKAYAFAQHRENELAILKNVCGKEISKHRKKKNMCNRCLR